LKPARKPGPISDYFRQIDGVIQTLDDRPVNGLSVKEAHWFELNLLLTHGTAGNSLYGIQKLDSTSKPCGNAPWMSRPKSARRWQMSSAMVE